MRAARGQQYRRRSNISLLAGTTLTTNCHVFVSLDGVFRLFPPSVSHLLDDQQLLPHLPFPSACLPFPACFYTWLAPTSVRAVVPSVCPGQWCAGGWWREHLVLSFIQQLAVCVCVCVLRNNITIIIIVNIICRAKETMPHRQPNSKHTASQRAIYPASQTAIYTDSQTAIYTDSQTAIYTDSQTAIYPASQTAIYPASQTASIQPAKQQAYS